MAEAMFKLKTFIKRNTLLLIGVVLLLSATPQTQALGPASFDLSKPSGTYNVGDYLTIEVSEDSGEVPVNAVKPVLVYNPALLSFYSIDASKSAFPAEATQYGGGGVVEMPRAIYNSSLKNRQVVASVTFKILAAGSATVSFASSSQISSRVSSTQSDQVWNGVQTGATYALSSSAYTGTPTNNQNSGTTPTPPNTTTGTSSGTKSSSSAGSKTLASASTKPPASATIIPVTEVPSKPSDQSMPQLLKPTNHIVSIKVVDNGGKAIANAAVVLGKQSVRTSRDGVASFTGVSDGAYRISITYKGKTTSQTVTVNAAGKPAGSLQHFNIKLTASKSNMTWITYGAIGVVVLFALGFVIPRKNHFGDMEPYAPGKVVVGGSANLPGQTIKPTQPTDSASQNDNLNKKE